MIQRTLHTVVTAGLAAFQANPRLYANVFGTQWGLSDTEVAGIAATFGQKPISVKHGYALADFSPPQVTILLQNESQSDFVLGDYVGQGGFTGTGGDMMNAAQLGSFWDTSFQLLVYTENPDATSYLYEMVKAALIFAKPAFAAADIENPMLSGMDLAPDARYLPDHLFVRALNFRCKTRFIVTDYDNALAKVLGVQGIYSPNVTAHPNGGVQTLVTPTSPRGPR